MFLVGPKVTLTSSAELSLIKPHTRSFADRSTSTNQQHKGKGKKSRTLSNHQIYSRCPDCKESFQNQSQGTKFLVQQAAYGKCCSNWEAAVSLHIQIIKSLSPERHKDNNRPGVQTEPQKHPFIRNPT